MNADVKPEVVNPSLAYVMAAEDLLALAWLHERERTPEELGALRHSGFPDELSLLSPTHAAQVQMAEALDALLNVPATALSACKDDLAADFAAIYLTHAYRAAPYESVWHDEENLMMQAPTFEVRSFYERHGFQIPNWRRMPDDHVAHQLRFTALLLQRGEAREAARFLKTHLMTWLPQFAHKVSQRAQTRLYAALAQMSLACVEQCVVQLPRVAVLPPIRPTEPVRPSGCQ
jgi:TorA maturation chaperone TorD